MSDRKGAARLGLSIDPETNAITDEEKPGGRYETVEILSLDDCAEPFPWDAVDFVKLDAEGQEHNIVMGGKRFLTTRSPLVMFELHRGDDLNSELIDDFRALGYAFYRLVPGLGVLEPMELDRTSIPTTHTCSAARRTGPGHSRTGACWSHTSTPPRPSATPPSGRAG
jgi:hypothetical protein